MSGSPSVSTGGQSWPGTSSGAPTGPGGAQAGGISPTPTSDVGSTGAWRPPPVPQPSLRAARSTKSSVEGSTASSVNDEAGEQPLTPN